MSVVIKPSEAFEKKFECNLSKCYLCREDTLCHKAYMQGRIDQKGCYEDGYADGSLSVTEQIINEKVVKYLEMLKDDCTKYISKDNKKVMVDIDKMINHFKGDKK